MGTGCRPAAPIGHIPVKRKKSSKFRRPYGRVWGILPAPWGALWVPGTYMYSILRGLRPLQRLNYGSSEARLLDVSQWVSGEPTL